MAQQNLDFNIAANVKGMEAIATLINRVGALEAETKRLTTANAGLAASTDVVIRNGVRYNNAMDAQSRQLRQNRQGTQQLGMQINDFATSVSSGSSVTQAFTQQLGQVGFAMSQMGGTAGKIGSFLAGPWGAAVLIGAMALNPIIEKLFQSEDAAKKAADAHYKYLDAVAAGSTADLIKAEGELKALQERRMVIGTKNEPISEKRKLSRLWQAPKADIEELDAQINALQLVVDIGNKTRDKLLLAQKKADKIGGSSRSSGGSGKKKKDDVEDLSKVNIIERNNSAIREDLARTQKAWDSYWYEASGVATSAMEAITEINVDATAMIDTLIEKSNEGFVSRFAEIQASFQTIGNSVANAFQGMLTGAMSWKDGMKGIINAVISELWRLYVVQQIVGFVTKTLTGAFFGGGGMPSISGAASSVSSQLGPSSFFGPGFANGTVSAPGGMAWVGERGPELVNLPRGSQVIPAHRAQSMGGGGVTVNVDARGSADPAAVRAQVQQGILEAAPSIIAAAEARTVQGLRRPRLGGSIR